MDHNKRQDSRYKKQYMVAYCLKEAIEKFEECGLLDISKGGLRFASYENHAAGTVFIFRLKFPFLYPNAIKIEGKVVASRQVPQGKIFQTSVTFINLDSAAKAALDQMEELNRKNMK